MNTEYVFALHPFPSKRPEKVKIVGSLSRQHNQLAIQAMMVGDIAVATASDAPARKHGLWNKTCFEFFLGIPNSPKYWEFNLAPSGDWNVYQFSNYRVRAREEPAFSTLPFTVQQKAELSFALKVDLAPIAAPDQALEVAITTVIRHTDGEMTYWALKHCGAEPDFHLRDSFLIQV